MGRGGTQANESEQNSKLVLALVAGHVAGFLSALLLLPAVRFTRIFWVVQNAPHFAVAHASVPLVLQAVLVLALVSPAVAILAWVRHPPPFLLPFPFFFSAASLVVRS